MHAAPNEVAYDVEPAANERQGMARNHLIKRLLRDSISDFTVYPQKRSSYIV
jgi:hypothetical protein